VPELLYLLLLALVGPAAGALLMFLLQPMLQHTRSAIEKFALPLVGALTSIEEGLVSAEQVARRLAVHSGQSFIREGNKESPNWPWRKVVKPLISLITFAYLAVLDLYLAALAFAALFGSGDVPNLHLSLPLLMGMLWPGLALAWAEALTDAGGAHPHEPYASLKKETRRLIVVLITLGLIAAFAGNIAFFLWRQGQLGLTNPYANLAIPISGLIGGLMFGALALTAVSGLPVLGGLVPAVLVLFDLVLLLGRGIASGARLAVQLTAEAAQLLLDSVLGLSHQLSRLLTALAKAAGDAVEARTRRPKPAPVAGTYPLRHHVGVALVDANRSFWQLAATTLGASGKGLDGIGRFGGAFLHDTVHGFGTFLATLFKLCCALALWLFYLLPRVVWTLWNWICRFDFASRWHFEPLPEPPPKGRFDARLDRLQIDVFGRPAAVLPLREAPSPVVATAAEVASDRAGASTEAAL
jgi:hypothetical protein